MLASPASAVVGQQAGVHLIEYPMLRPKQQLCFGAHGRAMMLSAASVATAATFTSTLCASRDQHMPADESTPCQHTVPAEQSLPQMCSARVKVGARDCWCRQDTSAFATANFYQG
jgi:hypothetical protein